MVRGIDMLTYCILSSGRLMLSTASLRPMRSTLPDRSGWGGSPDAYGANLMLDEPPLIVSTFAAMSHSKIDFKPNALSAALTPQDFSSPSLPPQPLVRPTCAPAAR